MRGGYHWSTKELFDARRMRARRMSYADIATKLGRTPNAVKVQLNKVPIESVGRIVKPLLVPDGVVQDRDRRFTMPVRDLTALILGDPPVGLSALEVKS